MKLGGNLKTSYRFCAAIQRKLTYRSSPELEVYPEISESERFPLLTPAGRQLLCAMRQHPQAPLWNWPNGEQLGAEGLATVERFARELNQARTAGQPSWLDEFAAFCIQRVPFYRSRASARGGSAARFQDMPSCCREDLAPQVWDFVPDDQPLDELIVFSTSGTTGHPTKMLFTPATAACGVPLLEYALSRYGIAFPRGSSQVPLQMWPRIAMRSLRPS